MSYHEALAELRRLGPGHVLIGGEIVAKDEAADRRRDYYAVAILNCGHPLPSPPPHPAVGESATCFFCLFPAVVREKR